VKQKTQIPFNPDTMTVSDLKKCAHTVRSLMEKYEQLHQAGLSDTTFVEELYCHVLQITDAYEVV